MTEAHPTAEQQLIETVTPLSAPAGAALAMHARLSSLLALYAAFYDEMMLFHISPTFDAKGSYSTRKSLELEEIKRKYSVAIAHERLAEHAP